MGCSLCLCSGYLSNLIAAHIAVRHENRTCRRAVEVSGIVWSMRLSAFSDWYGGTMAHDDDSRLWQKTT
jgi:hypothetical protein